MERKSTRDDQIYDPSLAYTCIVIADLWRRNDDIYFTDQYEAYGLANLQPGRSIRASRHKSQTRCLRTLEKEMRHTFTGPDYIPRGWQYVGAYAVLQSGRSEEGELLVEKERSHLQTGSSSTCSLRLGAMSRLLSQRSGDRKTLRQRVSCLKQCEEEHAAKPLLTQRNGPLEIIEKIFASRYETWPNCFVLPSSEHPKSRQHGPYTLCFDEFIPEFAIHKPPPMRRRRTMFGMF